MVQPPLQIEPDERTEPLGMFKKLINENDLGRKSPTSTSQGSYSERGRSPRRQDSDTTTAQQAKSSYLKAAATAAALRKEISPSRSTSQGTRGHARDPLEEEVPYLRVGPSKFTGDNLLLLLNHDEERLSYSSQARSASECAKANQRPVLTPLQTTPDTPDTSMDGISEFPHSSTLADYDNEEDQTPIVSESPGASEIDIYETAYREEIERIQRRSISSQDPSATTVYLTRRVENKRKYLEEVLKMISPLSSSSFSVSSFSSASAASEPKSHLQLGNEFHIPRTQSLQQEKRENPSDTRSPDSAIGQIGDKVSGAIASAEQTINNVFFGHGQGSGC